MLAGMVAVSHGYDTSEAMLQKGRELGTPGYAHLVRPGLASPEVGRWLLSNAGISLAVLGASIVGVIVGLASRVRGERWPWLGTAGAVFSSLPLGLFLLGMILKL